MSILREAVGEERMRQLAAVMVGDVVCFVPKLRQTDPMDEACCVLAGSMARAAMEARS